MGICMEFMESFGIFQGVWMEFKVKKIQFWTVLYSFENPLQQSGTTIQL